MITCSGCHTLWTGLRKAHCTACHHTFGGVRGFDLHRRENTCREPSTVGMTLVSGVWVRPSAWDAAEARTGAGNAS